MQKHNLVQKYTNQDTNAQSTQPLFRVEISIVLRICVGSWTDLPGPPDGPSWIGGLGPDTWVVGCALGGPNGRQPVQNGFVTS